MKDQIEALLEKYFGIELGGVIYIFGALVTALAPFIILLVFVRR